MHKTDSWKDRVSFYRFRRNEQVTGKGLTGIAVSHCIEQCRDIDHLLLIEDTSEFNLERHRGRITDRSGLGLTGNNRDPGFFCHPAIAVNAGDGSLLGALDIHLWHRPEDKKSKFEREYRRLPIEEKESYRWAERAIASAGQVSFCKRRMVVQDREGDIYGSFCMLQSAGLDCVIRSNHDRKISSSSSESLKAHIQSQACEDEYVLEVSSDNRRRKKRMARMELRYGEVMLCRPASVVPAEKYPATLEVHVVHVKEKAGSVPPGESPIEWMLYASHRVSTTREVLQVVRYYTLRWVIEDLFRTVKSEGVDYESGELESGVALRKLFVMALMAAIQILQLRQARGGDTGQKTSPVFSDEQVACMDDLPPRFEGRALKQQNPFDRDNPAWAAWIIARLGGWKGYSSQRPPGVIILHDGWVKFQSVFEGWILAKIVYKR